MKRRLFNFAAAVSLVAMIAVLAVVAYSYAVGLHLQYDWRAHGPFGWDMVEREVWLFRGGVVFRSSHRRNVKIVEEYHPNEPNEGWAWDRGFEPYRVGYPTPLRGRHFLGFAVHRMSSVAASDDALSHLPKQNQHVEQYDTQEWVIPLWLPLLLTALLPAVWVRRWNRGRRLRQPRLALCPTCGYDLRATPERCPECGDRC